MTSDHQAASLDDLLTVYDPPGSIPLEKVVHQFDDHVSGFMRAATFMVANVRDHDGHSVPVVAGGKPGFVRVLDDFTAEIDIDADSWSSGSPRLSDNAGYQAGLLLIIPGVKETLRMKGQIIVTSPVAGSLRIRLGLDNAFFHCGKALIRSRVWDKPSRPGAWRGLRAFQCVSKVQESEGITSFEFQPIDGAALPEFIPGQHLPMELTVNSVSDAVRRVYSLSSRPGGSTFRISVKREPAPALASNYLHDHVHVGSTVQMRNPGGTFKLEVNSTRPVVLLSAGVGLTPMVSMFEHLVHTGSARPVWYFHGAGSSREHAMGPHVRNLATQHGNARVTVFYSRPQATDVKGVDYDNVGRLTVEALKSVLPWDDYEYYVCGPSAFMKAMVEGLFSHGIRPERIRWEAFAGERPDITVPGHEAGQAANGDAPDATVTFRTSQKAIKWDPAFNSLLDFAQAHGVPTRSSCRTGSCLTCETRLVSGNVRYNEELEDEPDEGMALICCARPAGDLVLDL